MKVGILTSGGDCPGINATIRGVCKAAINHYGMEVYGIRNGFRGLLDNDIVRLENSSLTGLLNLGGTILGTSRVKPFKRKGNSAFSEDKPTVLLQTIRENKLDCIVCIGGNGTQKTAAKLAEMGVNVIGIPKTIDNDVWGTDVSFGFDSAVSIATDAIDRLHSTASSHQRAIVVVAEGIQTLGGKKAAQYIAEEIEYETGFETRETVLGYIQRGGSPTAYDRNLATRMGGHTVDLIAQGKFGRMVALHGNSIDSIALSDTAGKLKIVTENHDLIVQGRHMGICFG